MVLLAADQPARRRREREVQRRADPGRDDRPGHRDRRRLLRRWPRATATSAGSSVFDPESDRGLFLAVTVATAIAFFAMVGFEDSVNMVEETKDPERIFPRIMLTGLGIAVDHLRAGRDLGDRGHPRGRDRDRRRRGGQGPARGGHAGAPGHPDRQDLPVPHGVRGGQHRADQHADGQPAALRDGQPGRAAAHARQGARRAGARPWAGDRLLHRCWRSA